MLFPENISLAGKKPFVSRVNRNTIAITWTQDSTIPSDRAEYYGYTIAYKETDASSDFINGQRSPHDATKQMQSFALTNENIEYDKNHSFIVRPYRTMDGELQYGLPSETVDLLIYIVSASKYTQIPFLITIFSINSTLLATEGKGLNIERSDFWHLGTSRPE